MYIYLRKKILNAYATLNARNLLLSCEQDHSNCYSGGTKNFNQCIYIPQFFCMYLKVCGKLYQLKHAHTEYCKVK